MPGPRTTPILNHDLWFMEFRLQVSAAAGKDLPALVCPGSKSLVH